MEYSRLADGAAERGQEESISSPFKKATRKRSMDSEQTIKANGFVMYRRGHPPIQSRKLPRVLGESPKWVVDNIQTLPRVHLSCRKIKTHGHMFWCNETDLLPRQPLLPRRRMNGRMNPRCQVGESLFICSAIKQSVCIRSALVLLATNTIRVCRS